MTDFREINRMTLAEYNLRITAYRLQELDLEYHIALQAWMNREIESEKKVGKNKYEYVYREFKKFFDYEKKEKKILAGDEEDENRPVPDTAAGRYKEYMRAKHGND